MPPTRSQTASARIPPIYRFLLLNVESFFALGGVILLLFAPTTYTSTMTRHTLTTIQPASEFIYTELLGGYEHMLARHRGLGITQEQRLRFVTLLSAAADTAGLPDDPEFRGALGAYMEWAVHDTGAYPDSEDDVPPGLSIPRWSWDGLQRT